MEPTFSFEAGTYETIVAFFEVPVTSNLYLTMPTINGTINVVDYKTTYLEGEEIEIAVTPDPGYILDKAYYGVYEDHTLKKAHVIEGNKFRMPGYDTWLFATFVRGCEVTASASLSEGGTVTGGGTFQTGETVTLTATAKDGYEFVNWTENGEEVSTLATYQFTASEDRELVANFQRIELVYENYFYEDFGLSLREGWTVVDSDGDGHGWHPVYAKRDYPEEDFSTSGRFAFMSDTVSDDGMLDPDDWAITPAIIVPKNGVMTFWLTTYSANPKSDKLVVYVGLSPEIDKMTKVNIFDIAAGGGKKCKVRLSTFEGQKVYIGFRHYNSAGGAAVVIDDVEVDGDGGVLTDENLAIAKKSLTLYDTISIDFKIPKSAFSNYHDPYLLVTRDTTNEKITDYREDGDFWIFNYRVAPQTICDVVTAVPHALNTDGEDVTGVAFRYSVAEYCYNMLNNAKYQTDEYAVFRRLLVDILLYGDAAQIYAERKTNELAGAKLTDAQRAMGTDVRVAMTYQTVKEPNFATVEDEVKLASIEKVALYLEAAVNIRFKYSADDLSGLRVVITDNEAGTNVIAQYPVNANLIDGNGLYYVDVDALNAGQMRKTVYATVMKGNQKVSNTYCYSIESYVESRKKNGVKALRDLLDAMMRYGDSAAAYVESMQ